MFISLAVENEVDEEEHEDFCTSRLVLFLVMT